MERGNTKGSSSKGSAKRRPARRSADARSDTPSRERLEQIGTRLRRTIRGVLKALPGDDLRPIPLARQLGLNKNLTSRLLGALGRKDTIALLRELPGPAPLASFLLAIREAGATPAACRAAESALDDFRSLIEQDFGDKTHLDTLLASWLPEVHARAELTARQLGFRGASLVKGLSVEVDVACFMMVPNRDNPAFADVGIISGRIGLRRLRPGVPIRLSGGARLAAERGDDEATSRRSRLAERFSLEFSDRPLPLTVRPVQNRTEYWVDDRGIGPKSAIRFFVAEHYEAKISLLEPVKGRRDTRRCSICVVDEPCRVLVLDDLVHRDIWPHLEPELCVYDTAKNGRTTPMDEDRSADLMPTNDRLESLGLGLDRLATPLIPRYLEMIRFLCDAWGWNPDDFRSYRCMSRYPFYSSQISVCWDPFGAPKA